MANRTSATPAAPDQTAAGAAPPAAGVTPPALSAQDPAADQAAAKRKTVTLRHKTQYSIYRRAGVILSAQPKEYPVTAAQLAILKADAWVEVIEQ